MLKKLIFLAAQLCLSFSCVYAFDNEQTHRQLTEIAISKTELFENSLINKLALDETIKKILYNGRNSYSISKWIQEGSDEEDKPPCRASNHFHNPLLPWNQAMLADPNWLVDIVCASTSPYRIKYSNLIWATGYIDPQQTLLSPPINNVFDPDPTKDLNGRNWSVARELYYSSLTVLDSQKREANLAETFRTLGYQLHLLQDMAVPAHTRNDFSQGHTQIIGCPDIGDCFPLGWVGNPFEGYVRDHFEDTIEPIIRSYISKPYTGKKMLTNFWDTDTVLTSTNPTPQTGSDIGLAEYSNANFVSHNTIFKGNSDTAHFFDYPRRESVAAQDYPNEADAQLHNVLAKDGKLDKAIYIAKNKDGEIIEKFLKPRYLLHDMNPDTEVRYDLKFTLDDQCHLDYAKKLIPRAIGYSASLLDYFFRGKIDIQRPTITIGPNSTITFSIKNSTPPVDMNQAVEPFTSGNIELVYNYFLPTDSKEYYQNGGIIYPISGPTDPINSEYRDISVPIAIPANAYDLSFTLIFHGKLGSEENAVAAQVYKFDNSRIAYYYQSGGQPNTSNIYTISPDGSYPFQLTPATTPNPWYFTPAWSKDGSMMAFEIERCTDPTPTPGDPFCPAQYYSRKIAVIDLMSKQQYPANELYELDFYGASLSNPSFSPDGTKIVALKQNQSGFYFNGSMVAIDLNSGNRWIVNQYDDPDRTVLADKPVWSPTEDRIAYVLNGYYDAGKWQWVNDIFLVNPDGSGKTRLTEDSYSNIQPSWSPDGEWIVFSSDRDGEESMDIWIMDKNGQNLKKVYDCTPASCYTPTFSPNGRLIAFGNGGGIYVMKSDGDIYSVKEIAYPGLLTGALAWSPWLAPPSVEAQAQPVTILAGGYATLSWQSIGAKEVQVSGISGKQPANGGIAVSPATTTTYTITAVGPTGAAETTVTVRVQ